MFVFTQDQLHYIHNLIKRYPEGKQKSALIPSLHYAQQINGGWLSPDAMDAVANAIGIQPIEAYEVATFYSMFNMKPVGKYVIEFCRTGPCCNVGAEKIQAYIEQKLGIKEGETTTDGLFTLKMMECLGGCGYGPLFQIGKNFYQNLDERKVDEILAGCRQGTIPTTVEAIGTIESLTF